MLGTTELAILLIPAATIITIVFAARRGQHIWIVVVALLPLVGAALYWTFGRSHVGVEVTTPIGSA